MTVRAGKRARGFAHLITASADGIELWRGPRCQPGAMAWTGSRGELAHRHAVQRRPAARPAR